MVYKILFGLVDIDAKKNIYFRNANHELRGHPVGKARSERTPYKLLQGHCRVDVLKHSFHRRAFYQNMERPSCRQSKMTSVVLNDLSRF
jgi:hypothetical protein